MTKRFSVARNSAFNVLGWLAPAAVQLLAIPFIVGQMGRDVYGVWSLVMAVMGYFAFLDMNMLKGGIRFLAEYHGRGDLKAASQIFSFGFLSYFVIGLVGAFAIAVCVETVLLPIIKIPQDLVDTARLCLYLSAVGFLILMVQNYLLSVPKALHRFDLSNKLEIFFQVGSTLAIVGLLIAGFGLAEVVVVRLAFSAVVIVLALITIRSNAPGIVFTMRLDKDIVRKVTSYSLVAFAGRIGTSTTRYASTFVAGSLLGTTAITLFTVPFQLVSRVMGLSGRLSMVMFPIASELGASNRLVELHVVYRKLTKYLFCINLLLSGLLWVFAREIMTLWMGEDFAGQTWEILSLVSLGFLFTTTTGLPSLVNDGIGHPKVTSIFAFLHGAVSVLALILFGSLYGLIGIAVGFSLSAITMSIIFNQYVHRKVIRIAWIDVAKSCYLPGLLLFLVLSCLQFVFRSLWANPELSIWALSIELLLFASIYLYLAYLFVLEADDRKSLWRQMSGGIRKRA